MNTDFSNVGWRSSRRPEAPVALELSPRGFSFGARRVTEAFRGTAIVGWQGKIERQLQDFVNEATEARNYTYADKLRAYLATWRANPVSGSINVETIESLLAATEVPAVDDWKYADYFSNLRDQLRKLKASVEELPMGGEVPANERAPSSSPPSSFGPSDTPPPGAAAPAPDAAAPGTAAAELTGQAPENTGEDEEIPGP